MKICSKKVPEETNQGMWWNSPKQGKSLTTLAAIALHVLCTPCAMWVLRRAESLCRAHIYMGPPCTSPFPSLHPPQDLTRADFPLLLISWAFLRQFPDILGELHFRDLPASAMFIAWWDPQEPLLRALTDPLWPWISCCPAPRAKLTPRGYLGLSFLKQ